MLGGDGVVQGVAGAVLLADGVVQGVAGAVLGGGGGGVFPQRTVLLADGVVRSRLRSCSRGSQFAICYSTVKVV